MRWSMPSKTSMSAPLTSRTSKSIKEGAFVSISNLFKVAAGATKRKSLVLSGKKFKPIF